MLLSFFLCSGLSCRVLFWFLGRFLRCSGVSGVLRCAMLLATLLENTLAPTAIRALLSNWEAGKRHLLLGRIQSVVCIHQARALPTACQIAEERHQAQMESTAGGRDSEVVRFSFEMLNTLGEVIEERQEHKENGASQQWSESLSIGEHWTCIGSVDCLRLRTVRGEENIATNEPDLPTGVSPRSYPAG